MLVVILIQGFLLAGGSARTTTTTITVYSTKYPESVLTITKQVVVEEVAAETVSVIGTCTEAPGTISASETAISTQYIFQEATNEI